MAKVTKLLLSIREAERALGIANGSFWKEYVETGKIPVIDTGRKNGRFKVATHQIERYLDRVAVFPKRNSKRLSVNSEQL